MFKNSDVSIFHFKLRKKSSQVVFANSGYLMAFEETCSGANLTLLVGLKSFIRKENRRI